MFTFERAAKTLRVVLLFEYCYIFISSSSSFMTQPLEFNSNQLIYPIS